MPNRTIAIGDIHGCSRALDALLELIQPESTDTIVTLGDYVDRGPDSAGVVETLTTLVGKCKLIPLLGNHEIMMMAAASGKREGQNFWLECGGDATLASYGGRLSNVPQHHRIFFQNLKRFYESDSSIFVHACYESDIELEDQADEVLFWEHIMQIPPGQHMSGKRAFVGHTPQVDGEVRFLDSLVMIDTFCFGGKWLTGIDCNTQQIWQTDNMGDKRTK